MRDLSEREKTIVSIFKVDGRQGVVRYFKREGLDSDDANDKFDSIVDMLKEHCPQQYKDGALRDSVFDNTPPTTEKMTITFADGHTEEIDVLPDGVVVNPKIPQGETSGSFEKLNPLDIPATSETTTGFTKPSFLDKILGKK